MSSSLALNYVLVSDATLYRPTEIRGHQLRKTGIVWEMSGVFRPFKKMWEDSPASLTLGLVVYAEAVLTGVHICPFLAISRTNVHAFVYAYMSYVPSG